MLIRGFALSVQRALASRNSTGLRSATSWFNDRSNGFVKNSTAPSRMAWIRILASPCAVMKMIGMRHRCALSLACSSRPDMPGIRMSAHRDKLGVEDAADGVELSGSVPNPQEICARTEQKAALSPHQPQCHPRAALTTIAPCGKHAIAFASKR